MVRAICIFIFLLGSSGIINSQTLRIEGKVCNKTNKEPLPFSHVYLLSKQIGTTTNNKGQFNIFIDKDHLEDTLSFSFLGFENQYFLVKDLIGNKSNDIYLEPKDISLEEIRIVPSKSSFIGDKRLKNLVGAGKNCGTTLCTYYSFTDSAFYLDQLAFYVVDFKQKANPRLRFRLYSVNYSNIGKIPGEELLNTNIVIELNKKNTWYSVNLSDYNIFIESCEFFAGFEIICEHSVEHIMEELNKIILPEDVSNVCHFGATNFMRPGRPRSDIEYFDGLDNIGISPTYQKGNAYNYNGIMWFDNSNWRKQPLYHLKLYFKISHK